MKICIVASQLLGAGKVGGFGSMSMQLAIHLHEKGFELIVLVPSFSKMVLPKTPFKVIPVSLSNFFNLEFYRSIDADVYHSQNQHMMGMLIARAEPSKVHIVTCRDPRNLKDWYIEFINATFLRRLKIPLNYLLEESFLATNLIRKAKLVAIPANFLKEKVVNMYRLSNAPIFLPNIEPIPKELPKKSLKPSVIWVGRFSKRKHPERLFKLAKHFPEVEFYMLGKAEEKQRRLLIKRLAAKHPNVHLLGFKDKFSDPDFYDTYEKAWILLNTASREGLPLTFIEAAGRGCAILSQSNPDEYASKFGFWAKERNFEEGLEYLLKDNKWQELGKLAHEYTFGTYEAKMATQAHISLYQKLTKTSTVLANG